MNFVLKLDFEVILMDFRAILIDFEGNFGICTPTFKAAPSVCTPTLNFDVRPWSTGETDPSLGAGRRPIKSSRSRVNIFFIVFWWTVLLTSLGPTDSHDWFL